jgi:hypothetical protein
MAGVALWSFGTLIAPPAAHLGIWALCATRVLVRALGREGGGARCGTLCFGAPWRRLRSPALPTRRRFACAGAGANTLPGVPRPHPAALQVGLGEGFAPSAATSVLAWQVSRRSMVVLLRAEVCFVLPAARTWRLNPAHTTHSTQKHTRDTRKTPKHTQVPSTERSRAVTTVWGGLDVGSAVGLLLSGPLIRMYGWPSVFYLFAVLGGVWCLLWPLVRPGMQVRRGSGAPWRAVASRGAAWGRVARRGAARPRPVCGTRHTSVAPARCVAPDALAPPPAPRRRGHTQHTHAHAHSRARAHARARTHTRRTPS